MQHQFTTSFILLTEKCACYRQMNMKLHCALEQKNEQIEKQWKTIQALQQKIKPQVEKTDIGVQFNFLVPVSGNL